MKDGEGGREIRLIEIGIELAELERRQEAFVDDGSGRQGGKIDSGTMRFDALPQQEQPPFKIATCAGRTQERLTDQGEYGGSSRPENRGFGVDDSPAETINSFLARAGLDEGPSLRFSTPVDEGHTEPEDFGQVDPILRGDPAEESLRDGNEQARTVAAQAVSVDSAAMGKAAEGSKRAVDNLARRCGAQARDETNSAGVVVEGRARG
jgi:hypothetical protein